MTKDEEIKLIAEAMRAGGRLDLALALDILASRAHSVLEKLREQDKARIEELEGELRRAQSWTASIQQENDYLRGKP